MDTALAESRSKTVWAKCENPPRPGKCGLLIDEIRASHGLESFITATCHEDASVEITEPCAVRFVADFGARLRRRYPMAVVADIDHLCEVQPEECTPLWQLELQWLISHNAAVHAEFMATIDQLVADHEQAQHVADLQRTQQQREANQRQAVFSSLAAGLKGAGQGLSQSSTGGTSSESRLPVVCSSDYNCSYGWACVKDQYKSQGTCARKVDANGTPSYSGPSSDSVGIGGEGDCRFNIDCPARFKCVKGSGLTGHCMLK